MKLTLLFKETFKLMPVLAFACGMLLVSFGDCFAQSASKQVNQDTEKKELKVGDVAPDWELKGSDGKTYKLSEYKGKQAVVVAWYPKALTGG